ncbi:MAG: amino acid racemase [Chitinophagales bacterium]|nr:amino acid racemase [Chitinophagales bacterium]
MKLLGLIGGTSYHSTIEYYRLINEMITEKTGSNPTLLMYSVNITLMREKYIEEIRRKYLEISLLLKNAGAEGILICANTPHMVYDFVQPKLDIPILHIAEATAAASKSQGFTKLGLLGTLPTITGDFIPSILKENEIDTILPDKEDHSEIHRYISEELTQGKFSAEAKNYYLHQIAKLKNKGAEAVILGCTELPMLIKQNDTEVPTLDTTKIHANYAADFILGQ